jgi:hypothetical protein
MTEAIPPLVWGASTPVGARAVLVEGKPRPGLHQSRRETGGLQLERQRHGEAAGMGGGDQFFGICVLLALETGLEGIGRAGVVKRENWKVTMTIAGKDSR